MEICLDSLTLTDTEPAELIRCARAAGFDRVSLWVQPPPLFPLQLVTQSNAASCAAALSATGMRVGPLECFDLASAAAVQSYRPALELGARLGATSASAINLGNTDPSQVSELLAQFAALAAEHGLQTNFEPLATFATSTLAQAMGQIRAARADIGIVFDVFHFVREGGVVEDLRAVPAGLIRHIQLCDGALDASPETTLYEAVHERLYPGDGAFPLHELLAGLPEPVTWAIEAPSRRRAEQGVSAEAQAKEAIAAVRRTRARVGL